MTITSSEPQMNSLNVSEAKKHFSELLARVAFGGEIVLITRRGRPMAKLVPVEEAAEEEHLDNVEGWLDDDDPFFAAIDAIVAERSRRDDLGVESWWPGNGNDPER